MSSLDWLSNLAEIRLLNERLGAINIQALCDDLDSLYGPIVSATSMKYIGFNNGKRIASAIALKNPGLPILDLVKEIVRINRLTGMGISQVSLPKNSNGTGTFIVEIRNPILKKNEGAAGVFLISYWAGALTSLIGRRLEVKMIKYDKDRDVTVGELATKITVPPIEA